MKIKLNKKHEYTLGKTKLRGVTEFIHSFFSPFDDKVVARNLSFIPKYRQQKMGVRYWLKKWKFSRDEGTKIHKEIQDFLTFKGYPTHPKALMALSYLKTFDKGIIEGIQTEQIIFSESLRLAGTVDAIIRTEEGVVLLDWKSNEKISLEAYKDKKGILPPTKNTPDSNYWKYALQLNFYKYILEKTYNEKVVGMKLIQLGEDRFTVMEIPEMTEVVEAMIEYSNNIPNKVL